MKASELKIGKVYLVRGGHVLRYEGLWGSENEPVRDGYGASFSSPSHGVSSPAIGASISAEDVLQEVTIDDLPWLRRRIEQARARQLKKDVQEVTYVIEELTGKQEPEQL